MIIQYDCTSIHVIMSSYVLYLFFIGMAMRMCYDGYYAKSKLNTLMVHQKMLKGVQDTTKMGAPPKTMEDLNTFREMKKGIKIELLIIQQILELLLCTMPLQEAAWTVSSFWLSLHLNSGEWMKFKYTSALVQVFRLIFYNPVAKMIPLIE